MSHVHGHWRNIEGKLVWVPDHERHQPIGGHKILGLFDDWSPAAAATLSTPVATPDPEPVAALTPEPESTGVVQAPVKAKTVFNDTAGLAAGTNLGDGIAAPETKDELTKDHFVDVGIKIGGAVKDTVALKAKYWKQKLAVTLDDLETLEAESPELAKQLLTKEQQLGSKSEFLAQMKNQGATPGAAYIAGRIYSAIDEPIDTPAGRKAFALGIKRIESMVSTWKTTADAKNGLEALRDEVSGYWLNEEQFAKKNELKEAQAAAKTKWVQALNGNGNKLEAQEAYEKAQKAVWAYNKSSYMDALKDPNNPIYNLKALGQGFSKFAGTTSKLNDALKKAGEIESTVGWDFMSKKVADAGDKATEKVLKPWHKWVKPESDTYEKEGGAAPTIYVAQTIKDTFGIKGLEYGKSMTLDASKFHTQACGEALADLALVLGVDPISVSLNGRLKLGLGSRGHGKAKAHYEPNTKTINMTKMAGGGSLAHEWGHAMDNIMAMVSTGGKSHHMAMISEGEGVAPGGELPVELSSAFKAVHDAINSGDFQLYDTKNFFPSGDIKPLGSHKAQYLSMAGGDPQKAFEAYEAKHLAWKKAHYPKKYKQEAAAAAQAFANATGKVVEHKTTSGSPTSHFVATGQTMGEYWGRPAELFARAFESFIMDKLQAQGMKNTYLVSGVAKEHAESYGKILQVLEPIGGKTSVYPIGSEREKINAAMEKLVSALKTHGMYAKAVSILSTNLFDLEF
jgi:hypothetical protein